LDSSKEKHRAKDFLPVAESRLTPLFKQYLSIKREHPDAILLYRLGDFYEMFGPDAETASDILGIVLTARQVGNGHKVPMCGVPHHSLMRYVKRLVEAGQKVALCDQMEEPGPGKKLVRRDVTRIITAGTLVEDEFLSEDSGVFLLALAEHRKRIGFCLLESAGGRVGFTELKLGKDDARLVTEIERVRPQEVLIDEALLKLPALATFFSDHPLLAKHTFKKEISESDAAFFVQKFLGSEFLASFGLAKRPAAQMAIFQLVKYLKEVFRVEAPKLFFQQISLDERLIIDERAQRHLELFLLSDTTGTGAADLARGLLGILDHARTPMGRRRLRERLAAPFRQVETIVQYQEAVAELVEDEVLRSALAEALSSIPDIERSLNRVLYDRSRPQDAVKLGQAVAAFPHLKRILAQVQSPLLSENFGGAMPLEEELGSFLASALAPEPPARADDGGVIRDGFNEELDRLRALVSDGEGWFKRLQERERERTGIRSLRVKHTSAFGWFIEVTKANLHLVPEDYRRRQTLVSCERFVTEELAQHEAELAEAQEKALSLEQELYTQVLSRIKEHADALHTAAEFIAETDYLLALAETARAERWVRPRVDDSGVIEIKGGVHPLVQRAVGRQRFVANDAYLDGSNVQINVITGPNMGGKSTYLCMIALIVILAQMGGFVPAENARIGCIDRIFTRMGVTDAMVTGKSTFMVEMVETAEILNMATERSLVILDEIGRGTSTYDGISIARAVVEYLHDGKRAHPKTLFATHYFELTEMAEIMARIRNLKVEVRNVDGELVFLYKVVPGFVDESYGVEVARLAGLPPEVVERARAILAELEEVKRESLSRSRRIMQLGLFGERKS